VPPVGALHGHHELVAAVAVSPVHLNYHSCSPRAEEEQGHSRAQVQTHCRARERRRSPTCHSGSCFAQGTPQARWAQGNLAHSTRLAGAGVDAAGTEDNVREAMHGAWAVEGVCGMVQVVHTHWGAVSRNHHVGPLEHGFDSTHSRHPLPVAVQRKRGQCSHVRQRC
jgi:hypothetical protein